MPQPHPFAGLQPFLDEAAAKADVSPDLAGKAAQTWHAKQVGTMLSAVTDLHANPFATEADKRKSLAYAMDVAAAARAAVDGLYAAIADVAEGHGYPAADPRAVDKFRAEVKTETEAEMSKRDAEAKAKLKAKAEAEAKPEHQVLREADMIPKPPNPETPPDHTPPGEEPSPEQLEREADMVPKTNPPVMENRPRAKPNNPHPAPKPESIADPKLPPADKPTPATVAPARKAEPAARAEPSPAAVKPAEVRPAEAKPSKSTDHK